MKGTTFQKPLEFQLRVDGESWRQGEPIRGELTVKNHGSSPVESADIHVDLGHALLKKARAKDPGAFKLMGTASLNSPSSVGAGQSASFSWNFPTDRNAPITDNLSSLFLLYGAGKEPEKLGQLQLIVKPGDLIEKFLDTFNVQFRFVTKALKHSKGWVEAKLVPPSAPSFAMLEHVLVSLRMKDEALEVDYAFQLKKVQAEGPVAAVKKEKLEFSQSLTPAQYLTPGGRIHLEQLEASIREVVSQIEGKAF